MPRSNIRSSSVPAATVGARIATERTRERAVLPAASAAGVHEGQHAATPVRGSHVAGLPDEVGAPWFAAPSAAVECFA